MSCQIKAVDLNRLPPADEILSQQEAAFFQTLRFPKRRVEWLGGRFALKELVRACSGISYREIEVLPHPSGKPVLRVKGEESPLAFSITKEAVVKVLGTGLSLNSYDVRCINGQVSFFGAALAAYTRLGSPALTLQTDERLAGFMFTLAHGH